MKDIAIATVFVATLAGCATQKTRPVMLEDTGTDPAPVAEPTTEPEVAEDAEGEIDLGFDGDYTAVRVDGVTTGDEKSDPAPKVEKKRAEIGRSCGGLPGIRCQQGLYCKYPEKVTHTDVMGKCEIEPVNGRSEEPIRLEFDPTPGYK